MINKELTLIKTPGGVICLLRKNVQKDSPASYIYSHGNRTVPKIFYKFICSSLAVPLISTCHDSLNFENFIEIFTTSCLLTTLTNQNAHQQDKHSDWSVNRKL